ncbi:MAG: response regulator [Phycisphaerae bacterium]
MGVTASQQAKSSAVILTGDKLDQLLDHLDQLDAKLVEKGGGGVRSYRFRKDNVHIEIKNSEGTTSEFLLPARTLSAETMAFLHLGFIHTGTPCRIQLVTNHNMWHSVEATVEACRYVAGRLHDVRVRFDQPIDVAMFCRQAISRRILLVDDDSLMLRLTTHHLKSMDVEVVTAEDGEAGVEQALNNAFDCVLMDIEMPKLDGIGAIRRLRSSGYNGRVVAITALSGSDQRDRILEAGFDTYIEKPVSKSTLEQLIATLDEEPILSSLAGDADMKELIDAFVSELPKRCRAIEEALAKSDVGDLEKTARNLKGEAGGYGFEPITEAAAQVEAAARDGSDATNLAHFVSQLAKLCRLVRGTGM